MTSRTVRKSTTETGTQQKSQQTSVKSPEEDTANSQDDTSVKSVDDISETETGTSENTSSEEKRTLKAEKKLIKRGEKLFFVIPVEVESEVTLDDNGNIVVERKNFANWLKSIFSF